MSAPNTCDNCGEKKNECECGNFVPADALFDDAEELDPWDD